MSKCEKCINYSPRIEGKDKGREIADQNNERFGKKVTLTREQVEVVMVRMEGSSTNFDSIEMYNIVRGVRTILESFIEEEEATDEIIIFHKLLDKIGEAISDWNGGVV